MRNDAPVTLFQNNRNYFLPAGRKWTSANGTTERLLISGLTEEVSGPIEVSEIRSISTFEWHMVEGVFPAQWKKQKLVLLSNPQKQPGEPSSHHPVCPLDTIQKVFERMIHNARRASAWSIGATV